MGVIGLRSVRVAEVSCVVRNETTVRREEQERVKGLEREGALRMKRPFCSFS